MLIGWGVETDGTPYWIMQNSWGNTWGDGGFFKMKRGVNECQLESFHGAQSAVPRLGTSCSTSCQNGGVQNSDCSCNCLAGFSGQSCQVDSVNCGSGQRGPTGIPCICPTGYAGKFCQNTVTVSNVAVCATSPAAQWPVISWDLSADSSLAPPAGSRIVVFPEAISSLGEVDKSGWYPVLPSNQLVKGKFQLPVLNTLVEGVYVVYLGKWLGKDMGFSAVIDPDSILSYVYVVPCASVAAKNAAMSVSAQLKVRIDALKLRTSGHTNQAAMDRRLDAADAARNAILKKPTTLSPKVFLPMSSYFTMVNGAYLVYDTFIQVCYQLDATVNNPRKIMAVRSLWSTGTHSSTHTTVLSANAACVSMSLPGTGYYNVALLAVDAIGAPFGAPLAVSASIMVASASSRFTGHSCSQGTMSINVHWDISNAFYNDIIAVLNTKGIVLAWIYTATKTQVVPTALSAYSKLSSVTFTITGSNIALAGDTWHLRYLPSGSSEFFVAGSHTIAVPTNCFDLPPAPTTRPSTTQPPTPRPLTTRPPATQPPTTRAPTTQPPTTRPPTTRAPTTQSPAIRAPTTLPPTTRPPTTRPPTTRPPTTQPPTPAPTPAPPALSSSIASFFTVVGPSGKYMEVQVTWQCSNPSLTNRIGVFNSKGAVLAWIYTATKTQVVPKALSTSSSRCDSFTFRISKSNIAYAGDTWNLRYFPSGSNNLYVESRKMTVPSNF
jgi:hypothetical protein